MRYWVPATIVFLITLVLLVVRPVFVDCRSECPSTVMYCWCEDSSFMDRIRTYSEGKGVQTHIRARSLREARHMDQLMPLGYHRGSDSWIFTRALPFDRDVHSHQLVIFRGGRRIVLDLRNLPANTLMEQAAFIGDNVIVPFCEDGRLVINSYDLTGKLLHRRVLSVEGSYIDGIGSENSMAVSRNGSVGVMMWLDGASDNDSVFVVFDRSGRMVRRIKDAGGDAQLSYDGRSLAYQVNQSVMIMNLSTGRRQVVKLWPVPNARPWDLIESPVAFRWDSKNRWLLVAYEPRIAARAHPVYAADISSGKPRWTRLPIDVDTWYWTLLDE